MAEEVKRKQIKMTDLQKRIFGAIVENIGSTKAELAEALDATEREITPPLSSLVNNGTIVKDGESGTFSVGIGVEEAGGKVFIAQTEEVDDYSDYTDEELVTFVGEEGLNILKRRALEKALKNIPGVGLKSHDCVLHVFDADIDVRNEPTQLFSALSDCGIKKALLGRVVREVFLVEKTFAEFLEDSDVLIDSRRRRPESGGRTFFRGDTERRGTRRRVEYDDDDPLEPVRGRSSSSGREQTPVWAETLIDRVERIERNSRYTGREPHRQDNLHRDEPHITEEPLLDKRGKPIADPNNPEKYLMKRIVYGNGSEGERRKIRFGDDDDDDDDRKYRRGDKSKEFEKLEKQMGEQRDEIGTLKNVLRDHETDNKIAGAVAPLLDKIQSLESRRNPSSSTGTPLSDTQFKAQVERETIEMVTDVAERNAERMIGPLIEGQTALQKFQLLQQVLMMEKMDKVPSGTYLKHLNPQTGEISPDRVKNTLDRLKKR